MNVQIDQLVKSLLKKDSIRECSLQELEEFADRHPYFGAAQLLLTKKLQDERSDRYDEQLQKTFTFFNNPLWVQHLLNDTGSVTIEGGVSENKAHQSVSSVETQTDGKNIIIQDVTFIDTVEEPEPPGPDQDNFSVIGATDIELVKEQEVPASVHYDTSNVGSTDLENVQESEVETPDLPDTVETTDTEMVEETEAPAPVFAETTNTETAAEESPSLPDQPEVVFEVNLSPPATADKEEAPKPKEEMLFEPFHTVDYFASQGIKMKEDEKPVDRFGKQLKSFTDWLKSMKRLPVAEQLVQNVSPALEEKVEQLAAHSLDDKEVVTEAMAAVWEKQGNKEKAIQIYRKLSLLDPSKSVYFAAKIEDLKKKN